MSTNEKTMITIQAEINAPIEIVWKFWTTPEDIVKWNSASDEWHTPHAENDLTAGGIFNYRMEAKDGSMGFDFEGFYDKVIFNEYIEYTMGDGRKAKIDFKFNGTITNIIEAFEAESVNPIELQRGGWQAILDNFKKYAEANQ